MLGAYIYLQLLYLLFGLIPWSLCNILPRLLYLSLLKSILSDISIATLAFFSFPFAWNTFFPSPQSVCVSLDLKCVSCRQHIYGSCFFIHSATLCLLIVSFSPFTFKVIIDIYVLIAILLIVFVCWWVRLVPGLEQAHWRVGPEPGGFWGWCLPTGGWSWVPESLAGGPWGSRVWCLHTGLWGRSRAFWWAGPCPGAAVGSGGLKAACLLVGGAVPMPS